MVTRFRLAMAAAFALQLGVAAPAAAQDAHARPVVQLDTGGLALVDTESGERSRIGFGTGMDEAVEALAGALGDPEDSGLNEDCDAGALHQVDFDGGLRLFFRAGEFAGWRSEGGWSGANGIRTGISFADLTRLAGEVEGEETSLGAEFSAGGYHGLLTEGGEDGTISTIWAGTICSMR